MEEEDKPKSMWEATQRFILENYNKAERQEWAARFRAAGLNTEILEEIPPPKLPVEIIPPPPKPKIILQKLTCKICDYTWMPRNEKPPVQCPRCKSPYWKREKKC